MMIDQAYSQPVEKVLHDLQTDKYGLSQEEVTLRQQQYGTNIIPDGSTIHWSVMLFRQFNNLLVWVLLGAALISWFTGHLMDVVVIVVVVLVNTCIGFFQELKAQQAVSSLKSMLVAKAKVIRDGQKQMIAAPELVPGDILVLEEGDHIPADARLIESKHMRAIEAPLTGESVPVPKHAESMPSDTPLADQSNMVRKGTFIAGGFALAVVTATGMKTAIGQIASSLNTIKIGKTNFQKKTDVLARQMAIIAIISATILMVVSLFQQLKAAGVSLQLNRVLSDISALPTEALREAFLISIAALVSSIPEGLPAVLSIVLAIGANRMASKNAIIREFTATETLGAVTTIITDKTGTLTQNTLTVEKVAIWGYSHWDVTGEGWSPIGQFLYDQKVSDIRQYPPLYQVLKICAFCNNATIRHDQQQDSYSLVGDPTEGALLVLAAKGKMQPSLLPHIVRHEDMPFNSDIKMRASLLQEMDQHQLLVAGAPEKVLDKSTHIMTPNGVVPMTDVHISDMRERIEQWSSNAMRVIALAYKDMEIAPKGIEPHEVKQLVFAGIVGMIDPPRPDVKEAIMTCKKAGIRVIMATGDHINTAIAIAKATGILDDQHGNDTPAYTEKQLLEMDEPDFENAIMETPVFARLSPQMKLKIAEKLQEKGELIAMTGDGVNDAPALKKADVGVAMGIMGTDVARDAANVVLSDDRFSTIVSAVEQGRIVFNNTRYTSFFLLTTNFAEIATLLSAVALGMPLPLTATQILWLNLVTDGACTSTMATEQGHGDELLSKPVKPNESILNASILPLLIMNALVMSILALGSFNFYYDGTPDTLPHARSAAFIVMAFCQLFNVFNMRSLTMSIFKIGLFSNTYINLGLFVSVCLQIMIIEVPFFQTIFGFAPIPMTDFVIMACLSSITLWAGECYKLIKNKRLR